MGNITLSKLTNLAEVKTTALVDFRVFARQVKAVAILTFHGTLKAYDAIRLWLLAIGIIRRSIIVHPLPLLGHAVSVRPMTTDLRTLKDSLCYYYHRPSMAIAGLNTILDLGANVGYVAADFAKLFPKAKIIAVEMDANNYKQLVRNTKGLEVESIQAAVWIHELGVSYDIARDEDAYKAVSTGIPMVSSITMDTLIARLGGWVDYVKMDIEGGEKELITSDAKWLDSVGNLKVELHVSEEDCANILTILEKHGFEIVPGNNRSNTLFAVRNCS